MKRLNQFLFLIILIVFSNCSNKYERVLIGENVSIIIPTDFVPEKNSSEEEMIFTFKSDKDELLIMTQTINGIDTLSTERKEEIAEKNINGFAKAVNGKNIMTESISIKDDLIQSNYSMETKKHDSTMTVFGKVIIQDSSFVILAFITEKPSSNESVKAKDKIFNSIKMDKTNGKR